jgi:hypothetical protein
MYVSGALKSEERQNGTSAGQWGLLSEYPFEEHNLAHMAYPKGLLPIFEEFAASFEIPLATDDECD